MGDYFPDRRRWIHPADKDDGTSTTSDIIAASAYSERFAHIQLSLSWPERRRWGTACSAPVLLAAVARTWLTPYSHGLLISVGTRSASSDALQLGAV